MGAGGKEPALAYDDDPFSDDGEGLEAGGLNDAAALMEAVRSATEMLAAEGLSSMVDVSSIGRHRIHTDQPDLAADDAGYSTAPTNASGEESEGGYEDYLAAATGSEALATVRRRQRASATRRPAPGGDEEEYDDLDMGLMPEDLVSDEDSDYEESDERLTSDDDREMVAFHDTLRETAGFRRKRGATKRRAQRPEPAYSAAVQQLMGEANQQYVERELEQAFSTFCDVIREDASCAPAWTTMALIREEQGRNSDALHLYSVAAHLANDTALWERLYTMHMSVANANEAQTHDPAAAAAYSEATKQALYCLRFVLRKNPEDKSAWRRRLDLMEKRGDHHGMARTYRMMLRVDPHHMETIRLASALFAKSRSDLDTPLKWFNDAFAFYNQQALELAAQATRQFNRAAGRGGGGGSRDSGGGNSSDEDEGGSEDDAEGKGEIDAEWAEYLACNPTRTVPMEDLDGYSYSDLNMTVELRLLRHEHAQAIVDIKRGARFVQGRGREHQWEGRELLDETDAEYGDSTLPIELRVKLGQCRLMLGQRDAAQQHIDPLLSQDVVAYEDLFMDVADTYAEAGHGARAVEIYQMLAACAETNQPPVWERLAKCYRDLGDLQSARRYATAVVEADSEDADMRLWLGEVYEELGQTDLAYQMISVVEDMQSASHARVASDELAQQMVRSRIDDGHAEARGSGDVGGDASLVQLAERKPSEHAQRRRRDVEDERQRSLTAMRVAEVAFKKLDILRPQIEHSRGAVREYCAVARRLLADWRRIRAFYMANRGRPFQTYRNIVITNLERDAQSGELGPLAEASGQAAMRRQLDRMKRRLARQQRPQDDDDGAGGRPTTFRGHPFERWFDMFLAYAKCLALDKRPYEALEVLDVVCKSSVFFHSRVQHRTLSLMMLAVALNAGAGDRLYELLRGWCGPHPSRAARYKLFAFVMATSASAASMLTSANVYKFIRRQLDHLDSLYYHTHGTHEPLARDQPPMQPVGEGGIDDGLGLAEAVNGLVKSDLAALHSLAAHVMLVSRTGVAPLAQYTMALALVPQDASTALHLGVAYLVHSTKRDVGSAQAMVLRGLTYIERYAELRCMHQLRAAGRPASSRADVVVTQEIAYNFARAFHFVGLLDLAATYYHRVFVLPVSLVDAGGDGAARARCDLRSDAAYNLASIYTASGSPLRARALLAAHCTID